MQKSQCPKPREQNFLAIHYIQNLAKNPLFEAISLHGPTGPLRYHLTSPKPILKASKKNYNGRLIISLWKDPKNLKYKLGATCDLVSYV